MKKFLALILALVMVFSLTGIAFADTTATDSTNDGTYNKANNVTVDVTKGSTVYYVVIEWESLAFTYNGGANWNTTTHTYDHTGDELSEEATITVTNHSNAAVTATATLVAGDGRGFEAELSESGTPKTLARADLESTSLGKPDEAPATEYTISVSGRPDDAFLAELAALKDGDTVPTVTVGTVTVVVSPASSSN